MNNSADSQQATNYASPKYLLVMIPGFPFYRHFFCAERTKNWQSKELHFSIPSEIFGRLSNCSFMAVPTCVVLFRVCPSSTTFELNGFRSLPEQTIHIVNATSGLKSDRRNCRISAICQGRLLFRSSTDDVERSTKYNRIYSIEFSLLFMRVWSIARRPWFES